MNDIKSLAIMSFAVSDTNNKECKINLNKIEDDSLILGKFNEGNMWEFNMIFYPLNYNIYSSHSLMYKFNIDRNTSFGEILKKFQKLIKNQQLVLKIIFGEDIFNIMKNYLPNPDIGENNYLYIHKHIFDYKTSLIVGCKRQMLPNEKTLNNIGTILDPNQDICQINLRLRSKKLEKKQHLKILKY